MFRETLPQIYFNAFLVFITESSNMTVHVISMRFFRSCSYLIVLTSFWGVFSMYPARNNFTFRIIMYPSHFLRRIISSSTVQSFQKQSFFHFSTFWHVQIKSLLVLLLFAVWVLFLVVVSFFGSDSLLFCQKMRYRKTITSSWGFFRHYLLIYCLLIYKKNAVHENGT